MDSNNDNNKNKDSIIDILANEIKKREVIKEQVKVIKDQIDNEKEGYIEKLEGKYQFRAKNIDEHSSKIEEIVNSGSIEDLQDTFKKILDDMNK